MPPSDINIIGSGYTNGDLVDISTNTDTNDYTIDLVQNIVVAGGVAITTNDTPDPGDVNWTVGQQILFNSDSSLTTTTGSINLLAQGLIAAIGNDNENDGIRISGGSINSIDGAIALTGTGGGTGYANIGVRLINGVIASTGNATVTVNGTGSSTGSSYNYGVHVYEPNSAIRSVNGDINVTGTAGGTGDSNFGVALESGGQIQSTGTATINVTGQGSTTAAGYDNDGIRINNGSINSIDGAIAVTGTGGGTGYANIGVRLINGVIASTGNATVTINGTGSSTGNNSNYGVHVYEPNSAIRSVNGDINVTGTAGGTGDSNFGVALESGGQIQSTGTATINVTGQGSTTAAGNDNDGIRIGGGNINSIDGAIAVTGTGGGTATANMGVRLINGVIASTGNATVTVNGTGSSTGSSYNYGVQVYGSNSAIRSVNGNINVTGTGGGTGDVNFGVGLESGGQIQSTGTATINITGQGSTTAAGNDNDGIRIGDGSINSIDGDISLTGTGGGTATANMGVRLINGVIASTGNATVTVNGTGSSTGSSYNYGVQVYDSNSAIRSVNGDINVTGTGGGTGDVNFGVGLDGGQIQSTGTATINITGTGGGTGNLNFGVGLNGGQIQSTGTATINVTGQGSTTAAGYDNDGIRIGGGSINSIDGDIALTGTGGGTGEANIGVRLINGVIASTGNATVTVNGTGSSTGSSYNYGVHVYNSNSAIRSVNGDINVTGTAGGTDYFNHGIAVEAGGVIEATGNATITLNGTASGTYGDGIVLREGTLIQSNSGAINLTGIGSGSGLGINIVNGVAISSTTGNINLLASTIHIGDATQISTAGNAYINLDTDAASGSTSFGATVNVTANTLFLNDTIQFDYNNGVSRFDTINLTGEVDLVGSSLEVNLNGYDPGTNLVSTLISNDGTDAVNGTFAGLAEGDLVGTKDGYNIFITYQGDATNPSVANIGSGNDVQLYAKFPVVAVNDGVSGFVAPQINPFGLIPTNYLSSPTFADIDNDGDLDAFVGGLFPVTVFFENTGDASNPSFTAPQLNPFGLIPTDYLSNPTFADIDNDGDLDAFVGDGPGNINFFENTGDASNPSFTDPELNPFGLIPLPLNYVSNPTFADIDGDGDLDVFVGDGPGNINFFENTGDASNPSFTDPELNPFGLIPLPLSYVSNPTFADIDGDGDLDAFVGDGPGNINFFENTGNASNPSFTAPQLNPFGLIPTNDLSSPTFADIDGDGDLDAFVGEKSGNINFFEYSAASGFTTNENTAFTTGNVLSNDIDLDGVTLTVTGFDTTSTLGTVTNNGDGTFNYNPNGQFESLDDGETATDSFTYTVSDESGYTDTATVTITINGVNDAPTGSPTATLSNTAEDTAITINASDLLAGFTDVDGDTLSVANLTADNGVLVDNSDGTYTFTPDANFNGAVTLNYGVTDGTDTLAGQTRSFSVTPVNDAPTGSPTATLSNTAEDTAITITAANLLAGFSDVDAGDTLSVVNLTATNGALVNNNDGTYTFTPDPNFNGAVTLTYDVTDGTATLAGQTQTFSVTAVNDAPTGSPTATLANTAEDTAIIINSVDLLAGFSDVDGDTLSVVNLTATNGALVNNNDGTYTFTPDPNFNGAVTLTYDVTDGTATLAGQTQTFSVTAVNDAPTGSPTATLANTAEDTAIIINSVDLLAGFSDVDGDTLSVVNLTATNGALVNNNNGTYSFTPTLNFNGVVDLSYGVSDGTDTLTGQTRSFSVTAVNDAPTGSPTATLANTAEDTAITITAANLLAGFSDVDAGDTLSVVNLTADNGALVNNNNGTYTFTPTANFNGAVNLSYGVSDGTVTLTGQTQTFSVTPVNDAPVGVNDSAATAFNTAVTIQASTLLANDTDVDNSVFSITGVSGFSSGTAVLNNNGTASNTADDYIVFTPTTGFSGNASFNYTLSDGSLTGTAAVTIAVGANITGGNGNTDDNLFGTSGNDNITSGNGSDVIDGGNGNDIIDGGNQDDIIYGGGGNDYLYGGNGNDILYGDGFLGGGTGIDYLYGGTGDDILYGGMGNDVVTGNAGKDIFALAAEDGVDTITDFVDGQDKIGLYNGLSYGSLTISANSIGAEIAYGNTILAYLSGINANVINSADFVNL